MKERRLAQRESTEGSKAGLVTRGGCAGPVHVILHGAGDGVVHEPHHFIGGQLDPEARQAEVWGCPRVVNAAERRGLAVTRGHKGNLRASGNRKGVGKRMERLGGKK